MPKRFILNDEKTVNSFGFRVLTSGIDLKRFTANPVMLNQHRNNADNVIGKWDNVAKVNGQLLADAVFDTEDKEAAKIAGKVERGYLKSTSIGFNALEIEMIDGVPVVTKSELFEASIVAVPSNASAVNLYNKEGEMLEEKEIKTLFLSLDKKSNKNNSMKVQLVTLSALTALSLNEDQIENKEAVSSAILVLSKDKEELEVKLAAFQQKEKDAKDAEINTLLSTAKKELATPLTAEQESAYRELAKTQFDVFKTTLSSLPKKKEFSKNLEGSPSGTGVDTMEEFQKLSTNEQLQFKNDNPEQYNKILQTV